MQSVPAAMLWEFWRTRRWPCLAAVTAMLGLPILVGIAMKRQAPDIGSELELRSLQFAWILVQTLCFSAATLALQPPLSRLYHRPISTDSLVIWTSLFSALAMAVMHAGVALMFNAMFSLQLPVWGPALFGGTFIVCVLASLWVSEGSAGVQAVASAIVGGVLGAWLKAGAFWERPVSERDYVWMGTFCAVALWVGAYAVRRSRHGDPLDWNGVSRWLDRQIDTLYSASPVFRSASRAQFWFEWRQKGFVMPVMMLIFIAGVAMVHFSWGRSIDVNPVALVMILSQVVPLIGGMSLGQCAGVRGYGRMGSFLATRPRSDRELAGSILQAGTLSILLSWGILLLLWQLVEYFPWLVGDPGVPGGAASTRQLPTPDWFAMLVELGFFWILTWLTAAVVLSGRGGLFLVCFISFSLVTVGGWLVLGQVLAWEWQSTYATWLLRVFASLACLGVLFLYTVALSRSLLRIPTACLIVLWSGIAVWWFVARGQTSQYVWTANGFCWLAAIVSLLIAPPAAVPVALWWNRHR